MRTVSIAPTRVSLSLRHPEFADESERDIVLDRRGEPGVILSRQPVDRDKLGSDQISGTGPTAL